jgi:hypothetical protein
MTLNNVYVKIRIRIYMNVTRIRTTDRYRYWGIVPTFSEPLMMKYPPGSRGHSFNSVRSRSVMPLSRQYVERSMIGILPVRNKTIILCSEG